MRVIPWEVPTFEKLGLPPVLAKIAEAERGMVLVTGVTGSGKSSTMAALINYINSRENRHILTLENPIEFLHRDNQSSITQREIGSDTTDFKMGLRAALRQDPDVIMIGEMRDAETVDTAIKAAETGPPADVDAAHAGRAEHDPPHHGDVPAGGAGGHPHPAGRIAVRGDLAAAAAQEGRQGTRRGRRDHDQHAGDQDLIMDGKRIGEIRDFIAEGREQYGMQTFDQCLADLVQERRGDVRSREGRGEQPVGLRAQDEDVLGRLVGAGIGARTNGQQATEPEEEKETPPQPIEAALDGLQTGGLDFLAQ